MKGLSLHQPYPNLIALKLKTGETRRYMRKFRGELLICATQRTYTTAQLQAIMSADQFMKFNDIKKKLHYDIYGPLGIAVCVVNVVDWRPMNKIEDLQTTFVDYDPEICVAVLENIRPVVSFALKGRQGLFNLTPEEEAKIEFGT